MGKYTKKRKGFTLVELLMVIIIIGVLASSMLLVVGNAEDKAEATVIVSDMRSMKSAAILFKLKEGRWPVLASVTNPETGFGGIQLAGDIEIPSLRHLLILSATPAFAERPDQPGNSNPPGRPDQPGNSNPPGRPDQPGNSNPPGLNKDVPASGNEGSAAEADRSALQKMFGGASLEGFSIGKPETDTMSESYFIIYDLGLMKKSDGVRGKLALMAASAGLLNEDGKTQYNNGNKVLMKLD
jgi:prepilin-type N-terminal cleavage/methylation domain-containing protein